LFFLNKKECPKTLTIITVFGRNQYIVEALFNDLIIFIGRETHIHGSKKNVGVSSLRKRRTTLFIRFKFIHNLSTAQFKKEIQDMGGGARGVLDNLELMSGQQAGSPINYRL
jgi:hypothetical protein